MAQISRVVMSETTTYDLSMWAKIVGKERVYISKNGKDLGFYDVTEDCLTGSITTYKPEWQAKLLTELRAAFRPSPVVEASALPALVRTYTVTPCTEESDDLSATTIGVFRDQNGRQFEQVISRGNN